VGHVDVTSMRHQLPTGVVLFEDVNFRVGDGAIAALVGANGAGKTTLLKIIQGDLQPQQGTVSRSGGLGVMRQFVGSVRDDSTIRDLLVSVAPDRVRAAAHALDAAELAMMESEDEKTQMRYAHALADWGDAGGYEAEVVWDTCCTEALGIPYERAQWRKVNTLSGGEQKRLVLEALLRGPDEVLLLDEPDNYLDVPGKRWLEQALNETKKTVLFVSHDRELLARTATRIITIEGRSAWTHGAGFASYHQARKDRMERLDELHRRWEEDRQKLVDLVNTLRIKAASNDGMASRYQAAKTRLARFDAEGPPQERPKDQNVQMRLR
jgi:ATPase subunit of ABC transporter with duplicated ATPase domains